MLYWMAKRKHSEYYVYSTIAPTCELCKEKFDEIKEHFRNCLDEIEFVEFTISPTGNKEVYENELATKHK